MQDIRGYFVVNTEYIDITDLSKKHIYEIADDIKQHNKIFIFPTETVYGIGCFNTSENQKKIFDIKHRPHSKPLAQYYSTVAQCVEKNHITDTRIITLMNTFMPGPLTIIIDIDGRSTGIRIPDLPVVNTLIAALDENVAATSANYSSEPAIFEYIPEITKIPENIDIALYTHELREKKESTVISIIDSLTVLRNGAIDNNDIISEYKKIWEHEQ